jgi:hypothetical protein
MPSCGLESPWGCGGARGNPTNPRYGASWHRNCMSEHERGRTAASSIASPQATSRTNSGPLEGPPMCRLVLRGERREAATTDQGQ